MIDAQRQIGDISLLRGDDAAALAHYRLAEQALIERNAEEAANRDGEFANFVDNGALQNNMSLAYARDGDHRRAIELGSRRCSVTVATRYSSKRWRSRSKVLETRLAQSPATRPR